jgi:toxin CcdB
MARFEIFAEAGGTAYLLDCQADALSSLTTRFVVPLLHPEDGPLPIARLNPSFRIRGREVVMYTQFAASVPRRELGEPLGSLATEDRAIINALDVLLIGY